MPRVKQLIPVERFVLPLKCASGTLQLMETFVLNACQELVLMVDVTKGFDENTAVGEGIRNSLNRRPIKAATRIPCPREAKELAFNFSMTEKLHKASLCDIFQSRAKSPEFERLTLTDSRLSRHQKRATTTTGPSSFLVGSLASGLESDFTSPAYGTFKAALTPILDPP